MGIRLLDNCSGFLVDGSKIIGILNFSKVPLDDIRLVFDTHEAFGYSHRQGQSQVERDRDIADLFREETGRGAREPSRAAWSRAGYSIENRADIDAINIEAYRAIIFTKPDKLSRFVYTNPFTVTKHHCVVYHDNKGMYHITVLRTVGDVAIDVTDKRVKVDDIRELPGELLRITF